MYKSNTSHLHRAGSVPGINLKPPLPTTKPPIKSNRSSHIPTKMQSLDSSVVNRFLQTVENNKNGNPEPAQQTVKPQSSHLWKKPSENGNKSPPEAPAWVNKTLKPVCDNGSKSPPWAAKAKEPVKPNWTVKSEEKSNPKSPSVVAQPAKTPENVVKPSWNVKTVEKPKVWSPPTMNGDVQDGPRVNGFSKEPKSLPVEVNNRFSLSTDWKTKFEETERKRKELLSENQKVEREKGALERKFNKLEADFKQLEAELQLKSTQLNKLSQVSEKVYEDYDKLNNKYSVETAALHRALGAAQKWYLQNKKLRRASVARGDDSLNLDEIDGDGHELDELKKTVDDLSKQVVQLQTDLNKSNLQKSEAQKQVTSLTQLLEEERESNQKIIKELKELRLMKEKFESVTFMVKGEVDNLRHQRDKALDDAKRLQGESHEAKKERNVLAHQSSLLRGDIGPDDRIYLLLMEVEDLKRSLEESEHKHRVEVEELQERLYEGQSDSHIELLEEKLRLAESELQMVLERAEQAEQSLNELKSKANNSGSSCVPGPAPPPPPPPPPPMMPGFNTLPLKKKVHRPTEGDSLEDMARLLGIQRVPKPPPQGGAIDDIINEIKGGKFTLKATEKTNNKKEEQPAAVQEMLSIIGTLKRRPRRTNSAQIATN